MKRWRLPITLIIVVVLVISGISLYLSPDNLSHCGDAPSNAKGCEKADAIIAVSGGDTKARTQQAIDLYKQGWGSRLIFSGAALDTSGPSNAEVMQQQAIKQGVSPTAISIDQTSSNTEQNAQNTTRILSDYKITSAIVVTSGYHMKRTLIEFEQKAPGVTFRGHPVSGDEQWSVWWWTTPYGWWLAGGEIVKIITIKLGVAH